VWSLWSEEVTFLDSPTKKTSVARNKGFLSHGGTPLDAYFIKNPKQKWMSWG
jgi:hypothetical protein